MTIQKFRLKAASVLAVAALVAVGCSSNGNNAADESSVPSAAESEQINLFVPTDVVTWSVYLADAKGYFDDAGLNVKVTNFTSGQEASEAFRAQDGHLLEAGDLPTVRFMNQPGATVLSTLVSYVGLDLVVSKDIKEAQDLAGTKIAVNKGSSTEFWLDRFLKENGLDQDVELVYLDPGSQPPALLRGDVQGAAMFTPQAVPTLENPDFHSLEVWPSALTLIADDKFLAERKDDVIKVLQALDKAAQEIADDPQGSLKAVSGLHGLTDAQYQILIDKGEADFRPQFTSESYDFTQDEITWLAARGEISTDFDFCAAYDFSTLKEALPNAEVDETCAK